VVSTSELRILWNGMFNSLVALLLYDFAEPVQNATRRLAAGVLFRYLAELPIAPSWHVIMHT